MARLGYVAAVAGRSCLRRYAGSGRKQPSISGADTRRQVRPVHYTRMISKDHDDAEEKALTAGATPPDSPAERVEGTAAGVPASTALARVGRGFLLALPLAGAGAAAWVGRSDYHKVRKELRLARVRLALDHMSHQREVSRTAGQSGAERPIQPTLDTSPARCYAVALMADAGVLAGHLVAGYGLYRGWDPEPIVNAEIASLVGALLSTGGGCGGSIWWPLVWPRRFPAMEAAVMAVHASAAPAAVVVLAAVVPAAAVMLAAVPPAKVAAVAQAAGARTAVVQRPAVILGPAVVQAPAVVQVAVEVRETCNDGSTSRTRENGATSKVVSVV